MNGEEEPEGEEGRKGDEWRHCALFYDSSKRGARRGECPIDRAAAELPLASPRGKTHQRGVRRGRERDHDEIHVSGLGLRARTLNLISPEASLPLDRI